MICSRLQNLGVGLIFLFLFSGISFAQEQDVVTLVQPAEGQMVIAKKPDIECRINKPYDPATLYIELDYTDMTALADVTGNGFTLSPVQVLPPGDHVLTVSFNGDSHGEVTKEYRFSTRHTRLFEQADSTNSITVNYTNRLKKTGDPISSETSNWTLDSNINSQNTILEGPWNVNFVTNLRYLDQQMGLAEPEEKGLELINYQFSGQYEKGSTLVQAALGDVSVDYSRNTVSGLSRRGGTALFGFGPLQAQGFVVRSDQAFGLDGDFGLDFDNADHVYGGTLGLNLPDDRFNIKTMYATGGESASDSSYGVWPEPGGLTGEVFGIEILSDFFEQKLRTKMEWDQSDYDDNVTDSQASREDQAWLAGIDGQIDFFNYEVLYEYTGPYYKVPGNYSTQEDREGFSTLAGASFETITLNAHYNQHNDNVDNNPGYAKIISTEFGTDITIMPIMVLSFTLSANRTIENSTREPIDTYETKTYTDSYSGNIEFQKEAWTIGLGPSFSHQDDQTLEDYDTSDRSLRLYCDWVTDRLTLSPSFTGSRFKDHTSDIKTDTWAAEIAFLLNIIEGLKLQGNVDYNKEYDNLTTQDTYDYNANIQLEYAFTSPIKGFLTPVISLRVTHQNNTDDIQDTHEKETIVYLQINADLDLSF